MLAAVFTLLAIVLLGNIGHRNRWVRSLSWITVWVSTILAMLSYEGGIVAPFIVGFTAWFIFGIRNISAVAFLVLMPLYWWLRSSVHAVAPGGDYNVNWSKFIVNGIGNTLGYLGAMLIGPRAVEVFAVWRAAARQSVFQTGGIAFIVIAAIVFFVRKHIPRILREFRIPLLWAVTAGVALVPYVGLGITAERYGLLASVFVVIALGVLLEKLFDKGSPIVKFVAVSVVIGLIVINAVELTRVMKDWQKASDISQTTMLSIKHNFFPLKDKQAFAFVNTPIRYGRAWIFSTGLTDAMWHMFKFNPYPYLVYTAPTIEDAFKIKTPIGTPAVLLFDDMVLKVVLQTTKVIEVDEP